MLREVSNGLAKMKLSGWRIRQRRFESVIAAAEKTLWVELPNGAPIVRALAVRSRVSRFSSEAWRFGRVGFGERVKARLVSS